jgi:hypothetical protein
VVSDFVHAIIWDVADGNSSRSSGAYVDGIESDPAANDDPATLGLVDEIRRQGDLMENDDGVGIFQTASKFVVLVGLEAINSSKAVEFVLLDVGGWG